MTIAFVPVVLLIRYTHVPSPWSSLTNDCVGCLYKSNHVLFLITLFCFLTSATVSPQGMSELFLATSCSQMKASSFLYTTARHYRTMPQSGWHLFVPTIWLGTRIIIRLYWAIYRTCLAKTAGCAGGDTNWDIDWQVTHIHKLWLTAGVWLIGAELNGVFWGHGTLIVVCLWATQIDNDGVFI